MPRLRQLRVKEGVLKEVFQVFSILEIDFLLTEAIEKTVWFYQLSL